MMVLRLRQVFNSNTCTRKSEGPWKGWQTGLFPDFSVISCFTEHGHCMVSLAALEQCINYETAAHYAGGK